MKTNARLLPTGPADIAAAIAADALTSASLRCFAGVGGAASARGGLTGVFGCLARDFSAGPAGEEQFKPKALAKASAKEPARAGDTCTQIQILQLRGTYLTRSVAS